MCIHVLPYTCFTLIEELNKMKDVNTMIFDFF